ncbi:Hypothetical protein AA314_02825 [Archangium gephyra]|uniref:Uncharacterized protein n=1 Tax=Archangium gephyra TaxID=48 RepID=A0AAC8Q582_9BACT|nr:Hypothetical protein AA314_02825 [Archangium gephyra]
MLHPASQGLCFARGRCAPTMPRDFPSGGEGSGRECTAP